MKTWSRNAAMLFSRVKNWIKLTVMISASLTDRGLANKSSKMMATTRIIRELWKMENACTVCMIILLYLIYLPNLRTPNPLKS